MILAPTLLLNAGSGAAIARPTFSRDFAGEKTLNNGTGPAITFTRASNATFFDASGTLQTASNDAPRFDHSGGSSLGLLIEEARTNSIRNSQAGGSTNGVILSGGQAPTHWVVTAQTGISREIIGTGTVNGMAYIDMRFSGTATAGSFTGIQFDASSQIAALQNQTWTASAYVALVAGTLANVSNVGLGFAERDSGGVALVSGATTSFTPGATLVRRTGTRTLADASTAFYISNIRFAAASGQAVDFTLRIAAPQLEQGAFSTSYIPTTTAAATRAADSAVVTPISSFYNQSEGTLFAEFRSGVDLSGPRVVQIDDEASSSIQIIGAASAGAGAYFFTSISGTNKATAPTSNPNLVANTIYKVAGSVSSAGVFASRNGGTAAQSANGEYPTGLTRMLMGGSGIAALNGHIRKIAYWPKRLTNTLLEQLTT